MHLLLWAIFADFLKQVSGARLREAISFHEFLRQLEQITPSLTSKRGRWASSTSSVWSKLSGCCNASIFIKKNIHKSHYRYFAFFRIEAYGDWERQWKKKTFKIILCIKWSYCYLLRLVNILLLPSNNSIVWHSSLMKAKKTQLIFN